MKRSEKDSLPSRWDQVKAHLRVNRALLPLKAVMFLFYGGSICRFADIQSNPSNYIIIFFICSIFCCAFALHNSSHAPNWNHH